MPGDLTPDASERILIVDDDLVSRRMLSLQLQKTGYAVTEAARAVDTAAVMDIAAATAIDRIGAAAITVRITTDRVTTARITPIRTITTTPITAIPTHTRGTILA